MAKRNFYKLWQESKENEERLNKQLSKEKRSSILLFLLLSCSILANLILRWL